MKINDAGLKIIKSCEGLILMVYPDPGTKARPYTAGYGHAGKDVQSMKIGDPITEAQADAWLLQDLSSVEAAVTHYLGPTSVTENQFSALVSFAYNIGSWATTTLFQLVKAGQPKTAANHFPLYCTAAGHTLPGLLKRRKLEQALFNS